MFKQHRFGACHAGDAKGPGGSRNSSDLISSWSVSGQTFIFNLHVNVQVDLDGHTDQMVDFNMYDFRIKYDRRIVSDNRARAHYFNNMGVEYMLKGDTLLAFANYRESIRADSSFSPAWVNLGILNNREGYPRQNDNTQ